MDINITHNISVNQMTIPEYIKKTQETALKNIQTLNEKPNSLLKITEITQTEKQVMQSTPEVTQKTLTPPKIELKPASVILESSKSSTIKSLPLSIQDQLPQVEMWQQGLKALKEIDKPLSVEVKVLNRANNGESADVLKNKLGGFIKNIPLGGAVLTAGLRMSGPLAKRGIDGRGTLGQKTVIRNGLLLKNDNIRLETLTGEGPKDSSIHIPTGTSFCNVVNAEHVQTLIHWNTDPVDGTNPTAGYSLGSNGKKAMITGGTSIALFAIPTNPILPAFKALPDDLSMFEVATTRLVPKTELSLDGKSIEEIVEKNVKTVATAVLKERLKRDPSAEEYQQFLKTEFKVVLMNRPFQNLKILQGLKNAGVNIDFKVKNGKVDFSDWDTDKNILSSESHYKKDNVCLVGDGNVIAPFMKDVYMLIGNSGGPEFLQLLPSVQDMVGVFLSKENRDKKDLDTLIGSIVSGEKEQSEATRKEIFEKVFTAKDREALNKYGFDHNNAVKVFNKSTLIGNSKDYVTTFTAITPLQGGKGTFDVPDMESIKINPEEDTVETSSIFAHSSGTQLLIKEKFQLATKRIKNNLAKEEVIFKNLASTPEVNSTKYTESVKSILDTYFKLIKQYIFLGLSDYANYSLTALDNFIKRVESTKLEPKKVRIISTAQSKSESLKNYIGLSQKIYAITAKDLSDPNKLDMLLELKSEIKDVLNSNIDPYLDYKLRKDLFSEQHELSVYIKKLTDKIKSQSKSLDGVQKTAIQTVLNGKRTYVGPMVVGANLKTATPLSTQMKQIEAYIDAVKKGNIPKGLFFVAPAIPLLKWSANQVKGIPGIQLAAQTVNIQQGKENTGEVLASHLKELGIQYAMVGHLEERKNLRNSLKSIGNASLAGDIENAEMAKKVSQLIKAGIAPIICIGDVTEEKAQAKEVLQKQLDGALKDVSTCDIQALIQKGLTISIAYEPAWAIGSIAADPKYVESITREIRLMLINKLGAEIASKIAILYGGSVSPANVSDFAVMPNINGSLVGGASYGAIATAEDSTCPKIFAISHSHQQAI